MKDRIISHWVTVTCNFTAPCVHIKMLRLSYLRWWCMAAAVAMGTSSAKETEKPIMRVKSLDYLDAAALRYYLSAPEREYDVAVMFYASWCDNCHALAPVWEQISRILKAGTTDSRMIVGLFDCEFNEEHAQLCTAARVSGYPTLAFFSLAGSHHHLSRKAPKHMTKYAANWQYGEALLDWIRAMSAMTQWHRAGWGKRIRSTLFRKRESKALELLPLGVPKAIADEKELTTLRIRSNETRALAVRASTLIDVLLCPILDKGDGPVIDDNGKNYTDVYGILKQRNSWKSQKVYDQIVRACASELALDYCSRLSTNYMEAWIERWPLTKKITEEAYDDFQRILLSDLQATEPFCVVIDDCAKSNFAETRCQPASCPFTDRSVCRFLTSCLTDQFQLEYAEALELLPQQKNPSQPAKKIGGGGLSWGL